MKIASYSKPSDLINAEKPRKVQIKAEYIEERIEKVEEIDENHNIKNENKNNWTGKIVWVNYARFDWYPGIVLQELGGSK